MSPWASRKQRRFGNSPVGIRKMGKTTVAEFNVASKGMKLPKKAKKRTKRKKVKLT